MLAFLPDRTFDHLIGSMTSGWVGSAPGDRPAVLRLLKVGQDSGGDVGELIELLPGEAVDEQLAHVVAVLWGCFVQRRSPLAGEADIDGSGFAAVAFDQAAFGHAGELVMQAALLPADGGAKVVGTHPAVGRADRTVQVGQTAWSDPVTGADLSTISLRTGDSDTPSVVMAFSGKPIGQPVAMGGPFVMNNNAEIQQAFHDFHTGKFGAIPRQARLRYR